MDPDGSRQERRAYERANKVVSQARMVVRILKACVV
jgi:hypothetical protein